MKTKHFQLTRTIAISTLARLELRGRIDGEELDAWGNEQDRNDMISGEVKRYLRKGWIEDKDADKMRTFFVRAMASCTRAEWRRVYELEHAATAWL